MKSISFMRAGIIVAALAISAHGADLDSHINRRKPLTARIGIVVSEQNDFI